MPNKVKSNARTRPRVSHPRESEEPAAVAERPEDVLPNLSGATVCAFCKHVYVKPCTDKTKGACPNFLHLKGRKIGGV